MAPTNSYGQEMVSIYLIKIKITTKFFKLKYRTSCYSAGNIFKLHSDYFDIVCYSFALCNDTRETIKYLKKCPICFGGPLYPYSLKDCTLLYSLVWGLGIDIMYIHLCYDQLSQCQ